MAEGGRESLNRGGAVGGKEVEHEGESIGRELDGKWQVFSIFHIKTEYHSTYSVNE